ncbi:hypothetical protein [Okeania sp. SIO2C2]|nr:hypothetical protein [Okeania sp. SIO2C2]
MNLEVRYARSFVQDLKTLETAAYQKIYDFVFLKFSQINYLQDFSN